ncbi:hypothetical protein B296_00003828 [Ensete ventricosum]|uniref:Uncharacterized protein n=1 Tax=Ensete ventricosum TaxID=4639 RepID=A0A426Y160_ENSVE|nr:hypothetical protein B296_00003828 [Ensete ventricosum]
MGILNSPFSLIWRKSSSKWRLVEAMEALSRTAPADQVASLWFPRVALGTSRCGISSDPYTSLLLVPRRSYIDLCTGASPGWLSKFDRHLVSFGIMDSMLVLLLEELDLLAVVGSGAEVVIGKTSGSIVHSQERLWK